MADESRRRRLPTRSVSFDDLRLSMGASTLARHLQNGGNSQTPSMPLTRSSSSASIRERSLKVNAPLTSPEKSGTVLHRHTSSRYSTLQVPGAQRNDISSGASSSGWNSTFSVHSQVPQPLNISSKEALSRNSDDFNVPYDSIPHNDLVNANSRPKWRPVLASQPSVGTLEGKSEEMKAHPAVRVPTRATAPRIVQRQQVRQFSPSPAPQNSQRTPAPQKYEPVAERQQVSGAAATRNEESSPPRPILVHNLVSHSSFANFPWLQALAGFLVFFNVWGLILSYGSLQAYYATEKLVGTSPGALALIGSIQPFSLYVFAPVSAAAVSGVKFRIVFHGGSIILVLSIFSAAWCTSWLQLFFVQGILTGAGMSMIFKSTMESLAAFCGDRYSIATAIAASGSTIGAVVYVCIAMSISANLSSPWAVRITGFVALGTLIPANLLLRPIPHRQRPHSPPRTQSDWLALLSPRQIPFWLATAGVLLASTGVLLPFYSIVILGITQQHLSGAQASTHLLAMAAATLPGFTLPALLQSYSSWSILDVLAPCAVIAALVVFLRIGTSTHAGLLALAVVYGFAAAALNGLDLPMVARLKRARPRRRPSTPYPRLRAANRQPEPMQMQVHDQMQDQDHEREQDPPRVAELKDALVCLAMSLGFLAGPPIGGALIARGGVLGPAATGFEFAQIFAGTALLAGGLCFAWARCLSGRGRGRGAGAGGVEGG